MINSVAHGFTAGQKAIARLRSESAKGFVVIVAGVAISAIASVLIAKLLSAQEFGVYVFSITLLNYLAVLARGGMENTAVKYLSQYLSASRYDLVAQFVAWGRGTVVRLSLGLAGGGVLLLVLVWKVVPEFSPLPALVSVAGLLPLGLVVLYTALLRAEKRIVASQLPLQVLRPTLALILGGGGILIYGVQHGVAVALAEVVGIALLVWPLASLTRHLEKGREGHHDAAPVGEWARTTRNMTAAAVSQQLMGQADILAVGVFFGMAEAGVYGLASRLAKIVVIGNKAVNSIAAPVTAESFATGDRRTLQAVVSQTCLIAFVATSVMSLLLLLLPGSLFAWISPDFAASRGVLAILVGAQIVNSVTGPVGIVLMMTGHERVQTLINLLCGAALLIGIGLVAGLGGTVAGVAILFLGAMTASNLAKGWFIYRNIGVLPVPALARWKI